MEQIIFQNYHKHTMFTNPLIADSTATNEKYAARAKELGHGIISSCEHGYQGNYIECYNLAKKYDLKFLYCAEAYWVKDRHEQDKTNSHIILAALNESGRKDITRILSEANKSGFYSRPRVDEELLLSLNPVNVVVTTACVAFWKYDDIEDIVVRLKQHFRNHFFLEVQCHNTMAQQELNHRIKLLHYKYDIPLIFGVDSHYIYEQDAQERDNFLYSKEIHYEDEEGWYLDYPDGDTAYKRFLEQGILSQDEIMEAINNTNIFLQVEEYDSPIFNKEIKLPSMYPTWTQEQKDAEYQRLVWQEWDKYKKEVPTKKYSLYIREIQKEIDIVVETHMADYFILNYHIIKRGKEHGGVITHSGRGSAVSFITNKLLGFTEVDRIAAHVHMYPERFMSATRILLTGSLPDIDFNLGTIEPFARAQKEILGDQHAYPMIAYGTMQTSGAWKMYAKANDVPFEIANEVSTRITKYEKALKHADDDEEREQISLSSFVSGDYLELVQESSRYLQLISSWSIAPSAYLLYAGNIEEEIGLIRIKDNLCCLMDGHWAEENRFLKNDLLKVVVVDVIDQTFKEIGIPPLSVSELLETCTPDNSAWRMYAQRSTIGINQVERNGTSARVAKYKPTNIAELCAFIAAIRPGFKSMYSVFESRKPFSYKIPSFDNLIKTEWMPDSFVLYQEQTMATLNYAGFPMSECYASIKDIAKKRAEKVLALKDAFVSGFSEKLRQNESLSDEAATFTSQKVWQIIEDSSGYSFNASHAYCMALDSLYCAWLKANYPTQFYGVYIRVMTAKGNKDKVKAAQIEAESYFRIKFPPFRFGQDNSAVAINAEKKEIYKPLASIKGFNKASGITLANMRFKKYNYFSDLLIEIRVASVTPTTTKLLTAIDYFGDFGNQNALLQIIDMVDFFKYGGRNSIKSALVDGQPWADAVKQYSTNINKAGKVLKTYTIQDCIGIIHNLELYIKSAIVQDVPLSEKIKKQFDILGYVSTITNKEAQRRLVVILDIRPLIDKKTKEVWGYAIETQSIGSGKHGRMTIPVFVYNAKPVDKQSIIYCSDVSKNRKGFWYLNKYDVKG